MAGYQSWASSPATRATMQGNKRRDTKPELALRRAVHALGLRYRVDAAPVPGLRRRADLLFTRARVAVYIDGCFWHGCPEHYKPPATNTGYWGPKVERNRARDVATNERLAAEGWTVVRVWEHEDVHHAAAYVAEVVATAQGRQLLAAGVKPPRNGTRGQASLATASPSRRAPASCLFPSEDANP